MVVWVLLLTTNLFPFSVLIDRYSSEFFLEREDAAFYLKSSGFVEWVEGNLVGWGISRIVHVVIFIFIGLY